MEFLERTEHRENDEGGAGAYDTMRCDIGVVLHQYDDDDHHNSSNHQTNQQPTRHATRVVVWGQDFHLERLKNSYLSLVRTMKAKQQLQQAAAAASDIVVIPDESDLNQAIQQSKAIIDALLQEAVAVVGLPPVLDPFHDSSGINKKSHDDGTIVLVRVTLLWSYPTRRVTMDDHQHGQNQQGHHPPQTSNNAILVRGHATSSFQPMNVHQPHDPIVVSVVVPATATPPLLAEENATDDSPFFLTLEHQDHNNSNLLPNRFQSSNPHDKVASWCRLRKQLEVPTYKPPEAAEVLMVRPQLVMQVDKNHHQQSRVVLEILEGLSSNVFVIYKDGSLRTATEGVLFGYVRHLVIESAHKVGLTFDPRPIYLHESKQWQECFITSSSRLIWPIAKVMRPVEEDGTHKNNQDGGSQHFVEHWKSEEANSNNQLHPPKWQELLKEILKAGGYDT
jgi:Amino-transferase class IV